MDEHDLIKWHDQVLEYAKDVLVKRNSISPLCIARTLKSFLPAAGDKRLAFHVSDAMVNGRPIAEAADDDMVDVMIPLEMSPSQVLAALLATAPSDEARNQLIGMVELVKKMGKENPEEFVLAAFMQATETDYSDLVTRALRHALQAVKALAYIRIDEAWLTRVEGDQKPPEGDIKDVPGRKEAILVALEANGYRRIHSQVFHREVPDTGKFTGWGELETHVHRPAEGEEVGGRMTGLLDDENGATA